MRYASLSLFALIFVLIPPPSAAQHSTSAAQHSTPQLAELGRSINSLLDDADFREAHWGVLVVDPASGDTLFTRNAHKNFTPASNVKLYTTAAAVSQLGPDFSYLTELWAEGPIENGRLEGNLIVRGSADPTIGDRELNGKHPTAIFEAWADTLLAHGITEIDGSVIGDDRIIDNTPLGLGWSWSDAPRRYAAEIGGLVFNLNVVDFTLRGRQFGQPAQITWEPYNTNYITVLNRTRTTSDNSRMDIEYNRRRGSNVFEHASEIPSGRTYEQQLSITEPTRYFVHVFRETLRRKGITVHGPAIPVERAPTPPTYSGPEWFRVAIYKSPPLSEIMQRLNKDSQNLYAEQLLRTLGALHPRGDEEPGTADSGVRAAFRTLIAAGADTSRIRIVDGSGLSRYNMVSPVVTSSLLTYMFNHPDDTVRESFYESLPIGGVDGTLSYRFTSGAERGTVRAKTGTLSGASALSGYTESATGKPLVFVIMANHYSGGSSDVRRVQDQIVEKVTRFPW